MDTIVPLLSIATQLEPLTPNQLGLFRTLYRYSPSSHNTLVQKSSTESYSASAEISVQLSNKEGHAWLAEACLRYLLLRDFAQVKPTTPVQSFLPLFERYPLLSYCARHCMAHIRASEDLCQNYWPQIVAFLCQPNANFSCWWALVCDAPDTPDYPPLSVPALHVCARYGLYTVAERILSHHHLPNLIPGGIDDRNRRGDTALMQAALWGHPTMVELLVSHGAQIDVANNEGHRALVMACGNRDSAMVSLLLRLGSRSGGLQEFLYSPLAVAAFSANNEIFDMLREGGIEESDRYAAMLQSLRGGNVDITRILLRPSDLKRSASTYVDVAVECGHISMVEFLLSQGASISSPKQRWDSPLHVAARKGRVAMVDFLISKGYDLQQQNLTGETPLVSALRAGNGEVAQKIARAMSRSASGASLDTPADDGSSAVHLAYHSNDMSSLKYLLACGADPDFKVAPQHPTLLISAIQEDNVDAVKILLESGAMVDLRTHTGETPLHLAASKGNIRILREVIDYASDNDIKTQQGFTPTHTAAVAGHSSAIDVLVENKAILGLKDAAGNMEIHSATQYNQVMVVRTLLNHGQRPEITNTEGLNALHIASRQGFLECVEIFLENMSARDVGIEIEDSEGHSALHHAAMGNHAEVIGLLLTCGANSNHLTLLGYSPLHLAVKRDRVAAVRRLLDGSANVNTQAFDGSTPLISAAAAWRPELVRLLLDHGADVCLSDKFGRRALDWASTNQLIFTTLSQCTPISTADHSVSPASLDGLACEFASFILSLCSPFASTTRLETLETLLSVLVIVEMLAQNFGTATTLMEHSARFAKERSGINFSRMPCRLCHSQDYSTCFRCKTCLPITLCDSCHDTYQNGHVVEYCNNHEMLRIPKEGRLGSSFGTFSTEYPTPEEWLMWIANEAPERVSSITRQVSARDPTQGHNFDSDVPTGSKIADMNPVPKLDKVLPLAITFGNEPASVRAVRLAFEERLKLCVMMSEKAEETKDLDDITKATAVIDKALEDGYPIEQHNGFLLLQTFILCRLAEKTQHVGDFDRAIQRLQEALTFTPASTGESTLLELFCTTCRGWYDKSKQTISDLESKIEIITKAGTVLKDDLQFVIFQKLLLSDLYSLIHERTGSMDALTTAITYMTAAIDMDEERTRKDFRGRYLNLYDLYNSSYSVSGLPSPLDQGIKVLRSFLQTIPERNWQRAIHLNNLAADLETRTFHENGTGIASSIREAELLALDAFDIMNQYEAKHAVENVRGEMLVNLGNIYQRKFDLLGDTGDLDRALHRYTESLTKPMKPDQHATRLSNLGLVYKLRYTRSLELTDLETGIDYATQGVKTRGVSQSTRSLCLQGLAELYKQKYFRSQSSRSILDLAIRLSKMALGFAQDASRSLTCRETLFNLLGLRFDLYGEERDAMYAVGLALRSYLECTRNFRMANASGHLSVIGNVYARRSNDSDNSSDKAWNLTMAIKFHKYALKLSGTSSLATHVSLNNLALAYMKRHKNDTFPKDCTRAIQIFEVISRLPTLSPLIHLRSIRAAAWLSMHNNDWSSAGRLWSRFFAYLPILKALFNSLIDLQHALGSLSGTASWAAIAFLKDGNMLIEELFIVVETSRSRIASAIIESRGPVPVYKQRAVDIFQDKIQSGSVSMSQVKNVQPFEKVDYKALAKNKYIVSFTVTWVQSNAFILSSEGVKQILLPRLHLEDVESAVESLVGGQRLSRGGNDTRAARNYALDKILKWLWNVAVQPVLQELGLMDSESLAPERLPRVCWVTSGLFGLMPLHAAGDHSQACRENTLSRVVSSYTPSLRSLHFAMESITRINLDKEPNVLIVSAPSPPDFHALDTKAEITALQSTFAFTHVEIDPSRLSLIDRLKSSNVAHFVCHGEMDPRDPSKACLVLGGGVNDRDRLTLQDLLETHFSNTFLAYLSACSTAENSAKNLVDEVLHLASGFQLAGFPHVVGSIWEAHDQASVHITRAFYERLKGTWGSGEGNVAVALHEAILSCKEKYPDDALAWAPFIHLGP